MLTLRCDTVAVPPSSEPKSLEGLAVPTVGELEDLCGLAGSATIALPAGTAFKCPKCSSKNFNSYLHGGTRHWKCGDCGYDTRPR